MGHTAKIDPSTIKEDNRKGNRRRNETVTLYTDPAKMRNAYCIAFTANMRGKEPLENSQVATPTQALTS